MKKNNALYKGTLKNIILKLLNEEGRMYGYQMTQKAKELTQGHLEMTEGALYPLLHKLECEGVIDAEILQVNGRDRKYYFLTRKGKLLQVKHEEEMIKYILQLKNIFAV